MLSDTACKNAHKHEKDQHRYPTKPLAMQCYKRIFGNTMKARKLPQQKAEAWASAVALNQMTGLGSVANIHKVQRRTYQQAQLSC